MGARLYASRNASCSSSSLSESAIRYGSLTMIFHCTSYDSCISAIASARTYCAVSRPDCERNVGPITLTRRGVLKMQQRMQLTCKIQGLWTALFPVLMADAENRCCCGYRFAVGMHCGNCRFFKMPASTSDNPAPSTDLLQVGWIGISQVRDFLQKFHPRLQELGASGSPEVSLCYTSSRDSRLEQPCRCSTTTHATSSELLGPVQQSNGSPEMRWRNSLRIIPCCATA